MDSCLIREVTRLRRRACRWAEERFKCRYFIRPPAILTYLIVANCIYLPNMKVEGLLRSYAIGWAVVDGGRDVVV
jgi:hypothetical protein